MQNNYHVALLQLRGRGNCNLQFVPRLKMLRWIFLAATRYAEILLALYVQDILYTSFNGKVEKNKELKLAAITNPTPVYLEPL